MGTRVLGLVFELDSSPDLLGLQSQTFGFDSRHEDSTPTSGLGPYSVNFAAKN